MCGFGSATNNCVAADVPELVRLLAGSPERLMPVPMARCGDVVLGEVRVEGRSAYPQRLEVEPQAVFQPGSRGWSIPTEPAYSRALMSAATMILTRSGSITCGFQPSIDFALDGSPTTASTSAGRR
jgi:hypothetical protein